MKTEPLTKAQVKALISMTGFGAMIIDWNDIDYDIGRGVKDGNDRCIWNKDGRRIDITITDDGGCIVSQTKEPDPDYHKIREELLL